MSRISRYVLKEIFWPTLLGLLVYGSILFMNLLLEAAELLIRRDLPFPMILQFLLLAAPRILVLIIPMAVLLGVLVGIHRLGADSEIIAMRAAGLPDRALLAPVLVLGVVATLVGGAIFNYAVPAANYAQHKLNARIFLAADINREIQPRVFYERIPNLLIYADAASPEKGTLQEVLIYQRSPAGHEELSSARRASLEQLGGRGAIEFRLEDVVSHSWQDFSPSVYQVSRSATQIIDRPPDLFVREMLRSLTSPPPRNLREQTLRDLRATLRQLRSREPSPSVRRRMKETVVELHKKASLPFTSIVFALLALPLALGRRRPSGRTWGVVISILVIMMQYAFITAGEQMAVHGLIPPWVAMWSGNILFLLLGSFLILSGARIDPLSRRMIRRLAGLFRARRNGGPRLARQQGPPQRPYQRRFPSTIERYLLRHLLAFSTYAAVFLMILFSLYYIVQIADDLSHTHQSAALLIPYLLFLQPQLLFSYIAPISLCIGTLVSLAILARSQELMAMRAGGIGVFRVMTPFLLASLAVSVVSFGAHDILIPYTNQKANQVRDKIRNRSPRSYRHPQRQWVFGRRGILFNFSDFNPASNEFRDLALLRFRPGTFDIAEHIFAKRAAWQGNSWQLFNGWRRRFTPQGEVYASFEQLAQAEIDPPEYFVQDWKAPDQMNFTELRSYVRDLEVRGYDTRRLWVGLHRKISLPAVSIVMVLLGLPFALRVERRGPMFAVAVSIGLVFVFFGLMQVFGKLGEVALLPPLIAGWAPNILFSGLGVYLSSTARW